MASDMQLCPDCPFRWRWEKAKENLRRKQWLRVKDDPSALKVCMELRRMALEEGEMCDPYKNETLAAAEAKKCSSRRNTLSGYVRD